MIFTLWYEVTNRLSPWETSDEYEPSWAISCAWMNYWSDDPSSPTTILFRANDPVYTIVIQGVCVALASRLLIWSGVAAAKSFPAAASESNGKEQLVSRRRRCSLKTVSRARARVEQHCYFSTSKNCYIINPQFFSVVSYSQLYLHHIPQSHKLASVWIRYLAPKILNKVSRTK